MEIMEFIIENLRWGRGSPAQKPQSEHGQCSEPRSFLPGKGSGVKLTTSRKTASSRSSSILSKEGVELFFFVCLFLNKSVKKKNL